MPLNKRFAGMSRSAQRVANNLGIISTTDMTESVRKFRTPKLERLDSYYENRQYAGLIEWNEAVERAASGDDDYIAIRKRKPKINYAFAKMLCQRVTSKLVGQKTFPKFTVENDPDTEMFLQVILAATNFQAEIAEPIKRCLNGGSVFVRFYFIEGVCKIEHYLSKFCYPVFDAAGRLETITIKYVFEDPEDLDTKGAPKKKWYRMDLSKIIDVEYDNPEFTIAGEPMFTPIREIPHNLGYVQGHWFRTSYNKHNPDGYSLIEDCTDFIDEINYSLSQSSTVTSYNQDPQLVLKGMDIDEIDALIRSSQKAWNMGRDGSAEFLETNLGATEVASGLRDKMRLGIQDIARVVLLDPEKVVSYAQSGRAMEVLHGPLVELVEELRPFISRDLITLLALISLTYLQLIDAGVEVGITVPPGWAPQSLNITTAWPPVFPMTMEDLMTKVRVATAAASGNLISRETMTRWLAKDFDIKDVEEEIAKINAQPVINPFGGF